MEIIWVRHFMTPGNRKKQYIGSTDEPLDEEMIPQDLKNYPQIDALTVSPMLRCRQTAERIWPSMPFETEPLMRELDFGEYERKTYEELKNEPVYQAWLDSGGAGAFPGGEDREDFQKRCVQGAENMISRLIAEDCKRANVLFGIYEVFFLLVFVVVTRLCITGTFMTELTYHTPQSLIRPHFDNTAEMYTNL